MYVAARKADDPCPNERLGYLCAIRKEEKKGKCNKNGEYALDYGLVRMMHRYERARTYAERSIATREARELHPF